MRHGSTRRVDKCPMAGQRRCASAASSRRLCRTIARRQSRFQTADRSAAAGVQGDVDRAESTRRFRHFTRRRAAELMAASAILSGLIGPGIIVAASVCICPARRST